MKIGFIGAGKVGFSLGKYFTENMLEVTGYYSKNPNSAKQAAKFTKTKYYESLENIVEDSDTLFLTVPDTALKNIWDCLKLMPIENKNICHCSGSLSTAIFSDITRIKAFAYSIHPIFAVSDKWNSYREFPGVYFTIEGSADRMEDFLSLFRSLGNPIEVIPAEKKVIYHAASVMLSNQVIALAHTGAVLFAQCGFNETFSQKAWNSLFLGNAQNICKRGTVNSLTGPVERGDWETVRSHLEHLDGRTKEIYLQMSKTLLEIAEKKHPGRDYSMTERELFPQKK